MSSITNENLNKYHFWLSKAKLDKKEYQIEGVKFMLEKELCLEPYKECRGGIVADEMGLGKTIQMLGLIYSHLVEKTLIVLPVALLEQWENEIIRLFGHHPLVYHGQRKYEKTIEESMIVLTTYGTISSKRNGSLNPKILSPLTQYYWNRIIYDEGHHLRNRKTMSFHGALNLRGEYKWILTGTPIQNSISDLYSLCYILGLQETYFKKSKQDVIDNFIIKRKKINVGLELPEINIHTIVVDWKENDETIGKTCQYRENMFGTGENCNVCPIGMEKYQDGEQIYILPCGHNFLYENLEGWLKMYNSCPLCRRIYNFNNIEKEIAEDIHSQFRFTNVNSRNVNDLIKMLTHHHLQTLNYMREMCVLPSMVGDKVKYLADCGMVDQRFRDKKLDASPKMNKIISYIQERKQNGNRKIIFCHYIREITYLERIFQSDLCLNVGVIYGKVKQKERKQILKNEELDVLIMQVDSCCEGLNLQHFNEIYFTSPHWNPSIEDQAIARAHRIGQSKPVEVFRFEMDGFGNDSISIDNYCRIVQERKREQMSVLE